MRQRGLLSSLVAARLRHLGGGDGPWRAEHGADIRIGLGCELEPWRVEVREDTMIRSRRDVVRVVAEAQQPQHRHHGNAGRLENGDEKISPPPPPPAPAIVPAIRPSRIGQGMLPPRELPG